MEGAVKKRGDPDMMSKSCQNDRGSSSISESRRKEKGSEHDVGKQ